MNVKTRQTKKFIIKKYNSQYFYCTNKTGYIPYPIKIVIFSKKLIFHTTEGIYDY